MQVKDITPGLKIVATPNYMEGRKGEVVRVLSDVPGFLMVEVLWYGFRSGVFIVHPSNFRPV